MYSPIYTFIYVIFFINRRELYPFGVKVHIIEPGLHFTPIVAKERLRAAVQYTWEKASPEIREEFGKEYLNHCNYISSS